MLTHTTPHHTGDHYNLGSSRQHKKLIFSTQFFCKWKMTSIFWWIEDNLNKTKQKLMQPKTINLKKRGCGTAPGNLVLRWFCTHALKIFQSVDGGQAKGLVCADSGVRTPSARTEIIIVQMFDPHYSLWLPHLMNSVKNRSNGTNASIMLPVCFRYASNMLQVCF